MTYLSGLASVLALFSSLSMAWILFVTQQNKAERVTTYDLLKARLSQAQGWLQEQPKSEGRELCLSLVWELDKHDMSDLPQRDLGDEYRAYGEALQNALDGEDPEVRHFYAISAGHFGYIEHLLSRIGIISIRQIIAKRFLDTLAKGVVLVIASVLVLLVASLWYSDATRQWFVLLATVIGLGSVQLLLELLTDLYRSYSEDVDFIAAPDDEEDFHEGGTYGAT
ncbi:hypothetical protein [Comamonas testosteroni]|uniref:hypothetical protein n=1 Tax=Comamonas testosteroni TaxID=285 RepID=UPI002DBCA226|nr:hypothetical protein [Comamonas testosteroni]MEB5964490.1 hypothetical protein [Comamonas testosteroni]